MKLSRYYFVDSTGKPHTFDSSTCKQINKQIRKGHTKFQFISQGKYIVYVKGDYKEIICPEKFGKEYFTLLEANKAEIIHKTSRYEIAVIREHMEYRDAIEQHQVDEDEYTVCSDAIDENEYVVL